MTNIFSPADFNSNDGMLTTVWGPALWHVLHTISFNYPVNPTADDKRHYREFIESLKYTLPCGACRKNLTTNLNACPLTAYALRNRNNFSHWMYRLHEQVNNMLNKKFGLSFLEVRSSYENFRARCSLSGMEKKIEKGCVEPISGIKSKCVITILPNNVQCATFNIDKKCYASKVS